ncbi:uncharacterized protein LOC110112322 isoform X2 [Dendrobium catenatum]|uniref:uncharacterized protein LOC110112322 isoform X2 n=1 Tax=Dendrobium catenatum TaxID=906689 RepID=UPI00109F9939|nr:uncharacterized protein LOC110112322 isoform X2 [Dendrobium catenatum]
MGAVTSLLYGAEDPSIAGMVLDSAFSNLYNLMMELVDVYKIRLPKFTGDRNIIKFDGDHNSPRPQFYYDSVSIFFYNVLHPPQIPAEFSSKLEKYYDLGDLPVEANSDENVLYQILSGLRAAGNESASSSSAAPALPKGPHSKSVVELLSESVSQISMIDDDVDFLLEHSTVAEIDGNNAYETHLQDKQNGLDEESHTCSSSNRESLGRCSSLGLVSVGSSSGECTENPSRRHQIMLKALATPLRKIHRKSPKPKEKKNKNDAPGLKKSKRWGKLDRAEALFRQRLRLCLLGRFNHKRNHST